MSEPADVPSFRSLSSSTTLAPAVVRESPQVRTPVVRATPIAESRFVHQREVLRVLCRDTGVTRRHRLTASITNDAHDWV
jgi:hypothetical protein